jgi:hypothetical protein
MIKACCISVWQEAQPIKEQLIHLERSIEEGEGYLAVMKVVE